jgi:hypothetical protein
MISPYLAQYGLPPRPPRRQQAIGSRCGAILLLVLSMLTLFLMIGILLLVTATKTRTTARAFSDATNTTSQGALQQRSLLDEALLRLLRGPTAGQMTESILEDKYGTDVLVGTLTAYSGESDALIKATITGIPLGNPLDLGGRIVTFQPAVGDDVSATSYRIIRVLTGTSTFLLANLRPGRPATLPTPDRLPCEAIINGREFTPVSATAKNEAFDSYSTPGTKPDPWLTKLTITNSQLDVPEPAFGAPNQPAVVDNDNDGTPDGIWLEGMFPAGMTADGDSLRHSVSYLVLDLDSRLNLNAHGGFSPRVYRDAAWSTPVVGIPGLGAGPARIDASLLAPIVLDNAQPEPKAWAYGKVTNRWHMLLAGTLSRDETPHPPDPLDPPDPLVQSAAIGERPNTDIAYAAIPEQRLPRAFLGATALAGRYGDDRFPGIHPRRGTLPLTRTTLEPWLNTATRQQFSSRSDQSRGDDMGADTNVETWRIAGNSPMDLQGRLRPSGRRPAGQPVPSLVFDAPSWSNIPQSDRQTRFDELLDRGFDLAEFYGPGLLDPSQPGPSLSLDCEYMVQDLVNDPYEADLGAEGIAPSGPRDSGRVDQVFTLAELEPILRGFDQDTATLPSRLKSLLDDLADRYRTAITTDSWDTPGMVGIAAREVSLAAQRWNLGDNIYGIASPDVAAGLRFELNRPGMFRIYTVLAAKDGAYPQGVPAARIVQRINNTSLWKLIPRLGESDCFAQKDKVFNLVNQQADQPNDWIATTARLLPAAFVPATQRTQYDAYHVVMERTSAFDSTAGRLAYFTNLYVLLFMLQSTVINPDGTSGLAATNPEQLAQWAANVVEFRDPDSTMSRYVYDRNPADGWGNDPTPGIVFGCERPELVITETMAYDYPAPIGNGLLISLYRPWQATIRHEAKDLVTERIDLMLAPDVKADDPRANSLHLGKKVAGETQPLRSSIWRLRWQSVDPINPLPPLDLGGFESDPAAVVGTNQQLLLSTVPGLGLRINVNPTQVVGVYLERLANPNFDFNQQNNPYIAVDHAPIRLSRSDDQPPKSKRRQNPIWRGQFEDFPFALPLVAPAVVQQGPWFHWPNRDYIGHGELMLVPFVDRSKEGETFVAPMRMLQRYGDAPYSYASEQTGAMPEILDAAIVSSRFMGNAVTVGNPSTFLQGTAFTSWPCSQLSRWREPGRINLNTVVPDQPSALASPQAMQRRRRSRVEGTLPPFSVPSDLATGPITSAVSEALLNPTVNNGPWVSTSNLLLSTTRKPISPAIGPAADAFVAPSQQAVRGDSLSSTVFLSNVGTVRSHVFAVWITVKTENTMTGDIRTRRLFAIVDRSIPVGYRPGVNVNVPDTIRLKRYLD